MDKKNSPTDNGDTEKREIVRKIAEALPKDVGRGLARLDPADMAIMGIKPGDVVRLIGERETVAKVMPAFPDDRGKGIVQVDGLTRDNAKVSLGGKVQLLATQYAPAAMRLRPGRRACPRQCRSPFPRLHVR